MTLLVGIHCVDGIVIAADQQASRGPAGQPTVGSPVTKISSIKGNAALFAFSGFTGLGVQLGAAIETSIDLTKTFLGQVATIQNSTRGVILPFVQMARAVQGIVPNAAGEALCGCLVAASFADGLHLLEVSPQGNFDLVDPMTWTCIGSGQPNADPFMSFVWNVYWKDRRPTLREAVVTAYWGAKTTIESKAPGVGYDVDVFVLERQGGAFATRLLTKNDLAESEDFISKVVEQMRSFRDAMIPTAQTEAADRADEPPMMPAAPERESNLAPKAERVAEPDVEPGAEDEVESVAAETHSNS